jgi:hypothetical protein
MHYRKLTSQAYSSLLLSASEKLGRPQTNMASVLVVTPGVVPKQLDTGGGECVWLAYASSRYFSTITNGMATELHEMLMSPDGSFLRREMPCEFQFSGTAPPLPTSVRYRKTNLMFFAPKGDKGLITVALRPPFQKGFARTVFSSSSFTNVNQMSFPTEIELDDYTPKTPATNASDLRCALTEKGELTEVSVPTEPLDLSLPKQRFVVTDYRLPGPPVQFKVSDGHIPPTTDPALVKLRNEAAIEAVPPRGE